MSNSNINSENYLIFLKEIWNTIILENYIFYNKIKILLKFCWFTFFNETFNKIIITLDFLWFETQPLIDDFIEYSNYVIKVDFPNFLENVKIFFIRFEKSLRIIYRFCEIIFFFAEHYCEVNNSWYNIVVVFEMWCLIVKQIISTIVIYLMCFFKPLIFILEPDFCKSIDKIEDDLNLEPGFIIPFVQSYWEDFSYQVGIEIKNHSNFLSKEFDYLINFCLEKKNYNLMEIKILHQIVFIITTINIFLIRSTSWYVSEAKKFSKWLLNLNNEFKKQTQIISKIVCYFSIFSIVNFFMISFFNKPNAPVKFKSPFLPLFNSLIFIFIEILFFIFWLTTLMLIFFFFPLLPAIVLIRKIKVLFLNKINKIIKVVIKVYKFLISFNKNDFFFILIFLIFFCMFFYILLLQYLAFFVYDPIFFPTYYPVNPYSKKRFLNIFNIIYYWESYFNLFKEFIIPQLVFLCFSTLYIYKIITVNIANKLMYLIDESSFWIFNNIIYYWPKFCQFWNNFIQWLFPIISFCFDTYKIWFQLKLIFTWGFWCNWCNNYLLYKYWLFLNFYITPYFLIIWNYFLKPYIIYFYFIDLFTLLHIKFFILINVFVMNLLLVNEIKFLWIIVITILMFIYINMVLYWMFVHNLQNEFIFFSFNILFFIFFTQKGYPSIFILTSITFINIKLHLIFFEKYYHCKIFFYNIFVKLIYIYLLFCIFFFLVNFKWLFSLKKSFPYDSPERTTNYIYTLLIIYLTFSSVFYTFIILVPVSFILVFLIVRLECWGIQKIKNWNKKINTFY